MRLPVVTQWPAEPTTPVIAVGPMTALDQFAGPGAAALAAEQGARPPEGFRIRTHMPPGRAPAIIVAGNDSRGVLFGVGKLLRSLEMSRDRIALPSALDRSEAPAMVIRGHQIGYRPKTNSYDAWDLPQWEQYMRDMAIFGCNAIEIIPPRSDDDADSPHFPRPPLEMMAGMSQLAADYGLDVWIWYPAMESRYATPAAVEAALSEWGDVLKKLPRVDALFVPTGDPGDVPPGELMTMLEAQTRQLQQLHPGAQMWISVQSFDEQQFADMLRILQREPPWLTGVVYGPQTRISVARLRELLPRRYALRAYPDITHSLRCQHPVPDWDLAYALTEGREVINPRPLDEAAIFHSYRDHVGGVITYSEGCNDDVNKMIWSGLCWNPATPPIDTLREYSRYFIGPQYTDDFAQGLLALERNWRGPLLANTAVDATWQQFRTLEQAAEPRTRRNWRFQQAQYRAAYDAYQHRRLTLETAQEMEARQLLARAADLSVASALKAAETVLDRADRAGQLQPLKSRVNELAEALFQSIGMQLSVEKYQAIEVGRGANLDTLDVPLNNREWLKRRFTDIRKLSSEAEMLRAVEQLLHWTDPGPGGFYDDLGNTARQPHLVRETAYAADPGFLASPYIGFHAHPGMPRSSWDYVDGLYGTPVTMHYTGLDPAARYTLRVVYAGENKDALVRLVALVKSAADGEAREIEVHPLQPKPWPVRPAEYALPPESTAGGELTLRWTSNPERGGPGRGCQIAEVWLETP